MPAQSYCRVPAAWATSNGVAAVRTAIADMLPPNAVVHYRHCVCNPVQCINTLGEGGGVVPLQGNAMTRCTCMHGLHAGTRKRTGARQAIAPAAATTRRCPAQPRGPPARAVLRRRRRHPRHRPRGLGPSPTPPACFGCTNATARASG